MSEQKVYGEIEYINAVKEGVGNLKAYTEIQASNERHLKMNNLLLCELIKQVKGLSENLYLFATATEEDSGVDIPSALLGSMKPIKVVEPVTSTVVEIPDVKTNGITVIDLSKVPQAAAPEKPVETVVEKYGLKQPAFSGKRETVIPPVMKGSPIPKHMFGKIPKKFDSDTTVVSQ